MQRLGRAGDVVQVLLDVGVVDLAQVARVGDPQDCVGAPGVLTNERRVLRVLTNERRDDFYLPTVQSLLARQISLHLHSSSS